MYKVKWLNKNLKIICKKYLKELDVRTEKYVKQLKLKHIFF